MHEQVAGKGSELERLIFDVCLTLARELGTLSDALRSESSLSLDFGIDSLSRLELRARLEARLGTPVSEELVMVARTPREIAHGLSLDETSRAAQLYLNDLDRKMRADPSALQSYITAAPPAPFRPLSSGELVYALWCWFVFGAGVVIAVSLAALTPRLTARRARTRSVARAVLALLGVKLTVPGAELLPRGQPAVVVVNHSSYIDAIVLMAALPPLLTPIAKQEFQEQWLMRSLLDLFGVVYVRRQVPADSVHGAIEAMKRLEQGEWPLFFPEGTFIAEPGLRPFRLGAFWVAAHAGVDVIPMTLRGTREMLPDGVWLPRRAALELHIGRPLTPTGSDWEAAVELRREAFNAIASAL